MRLTWKDALGTVLVAAVGTVTLAVTQGWEWPLLGSYRTGTLALFVLGQGACAASGVSQEWGARKSAAVMLATGIGVIAFVLVIVGLITGTRTPFLALAAVTALLWIVTTLRHAFGAGTPTPASA